MRALALLTLTGAAAVSACRTELDCSLNGVCTAGACRCDAGWKGGDCGVLNELPARRDTGYQPRDAAGRISSWGGSIVRDPATGAWLLFASEFVNHCGLGDWSPNSRVVLAKAVGDDPAGPYEFVKEVLPTFAHNPSVVSTHDGKWIMYTIGRPCTKVRNCTPGAAPGWARGAREAPCPRPNDPAPGNMESGVSAFITGNLTGAWTRVGDGYVLGDGGAGWNADTTNPYGYVKPDGSVLMMYRGCAKGCSGSTEQLGLAGAGHYTDAALTRLNGDAPLAWPRDPALTNNEDPFIYQDARGRYHALLHQLFPKGGFGCYEKAGVWHGCEVGRHAFSYDGLEWHWSATTPYNTTVQYTDGTSEVLYRRERPHLLIQDGVITHMTNGVSVASGYAHTMIVPINTE